jgi:hypothetical protein
MVTQNGSFKYQKPKAKLIGANGNIYNLLGIAMQALRKGKFISAANEMRDKVYSSKSYEEALAIISEYVDII